MSDPASNLIDLKVRKKLGEFRLDAELHDDGFLCLTGRNGSGKSSLLNVISGILAPDEGFVKLNSVNITNLPVEKRGTVLVTPDSHIPHLDVERHLIWGAKVRGIDVDEKFVERVKRELGISFAGKVGRLSLGMKERVALATCLISRPQAILVDETFSSIDDEENFVSSYRCMASDLKIDVIFTSQRIEDSKLAEHHYGIENGRLSKIS